MVYTKWGKHAIHRKWSRARFLNSSPEVRRDALVIVKHSDIFLSFEHLAR